jgi:hypothetical protein
MVISRSAVEAIRASWVAAAARPHDRDGLAGRDVKVDVIDGADQADVLAVGLAEAAGAEQGS